jgi:hypothetical protein
MYTTPIAISNGTATISYDFRGSQINQSEYKDGSAALDQPHLLKISHQETGAGLKRRRRSLWSIDKVVEDSTSGEQGLLRVYLIADIPQGIATSTQVTEQITLMKSFLSTAGVIAKMVSADI